MITFLTDFGTRDYFVPAVKGVILSLNPQATIIDLTHEVPAHDIEFAAFMLSACWRDFPAGTIHLAVVDPGVGSERRIIIAEADGHLFVGPDNGLFTHCLVQASSSRVFHVTRRDLFRHPISPTFHGRDVFAPLAAHLSLGMKPEAMGEAITDFNRLEITSPTASESGTIITGAIIHTDHFGNCITNLTTRELNPADVNEQTRLRIGDHEVRHFGTHFAQLPKADELFAYPGSAGYWEIAVWQASAARLLRAQRGTRVTLESQR